MSMPNADTLSPREMIYETIEAGDKIVVVDLFCGAGGMTTGAMRALESIAEDVNQPLEEIVELIAVNHWDRAIETHDANYPWATQFHTEIQRLRPSDIVTDERTSLEPGDPIHLLTACPDCTYFSSARGGGRKDPDSRATPREIIDWLERLNVRNFLFENVPEFRQWGPLDDDDRVIKSKKGEFFENWLSEIGIAGFNVEWDVLNAANYGDATSRKRLFVAGRKDSGVIWPSPSHSEDGEAPDTEPWRTAADIIDWTDPGESLWIRDLNDGRRKPLKNTTMKRIAEGIRRHGHDLLTPFADAIDEIGRDEVYQLRENIVPSSLAPVAAQQLTEPFLVKYYGTSTVADVDTPLDTITSGGQKFGLCTTYVCGHASPIDAQSVTDRPIPTSTGENRPPVRSETFILGQQSGAVAHPATEKALPTVATRGAISQFTASPFVLPKNGRQRGLFSNRSYLEQPLHTVVAGRIDQGYTVNPYLVPFYGERPSQRPRTHDIEPPTPTIPASTISRGLIEPYLVEYYGNGTTRPLSDPLPTVTTKDRFALVIPELFPLGIDIQFRMLKPSELAAAMGFTDFEITGNKTDTVKQIGNAVPVNTAESLCHEMLLGEAATIDSFRTDSKSPTPADD